MDSRSATPSATGGAPRGRPVRKLHPTGGPRRRRSPAGNAWVALLVLATLSAAAGEEPREAPAWLGIYTEPVAPLPAAAAGGTEGALLAGARAGLRVTALFPDSPAEEGGLETGDLIFAIDGEPLVAARDELGRLLRTLLAERRAGDTLQLAVLREAIDRRITADGTTDSALVARLLWRHPGALGDSLPCGSAFRAHWQKERRTLALTIPLGLRPEARWPPPRENARIDPGGRYTVSEFAPIVWELAEQYGVRAETEDLLQRLARCHQSADPYRLECVLYAHRDPFRLESVARRITGNLLPVSRVRDLLYRCGPLLAPRWGPSAPIGERRVLRPGADLTTLLDQIERVLADASAWHRRAFAGLTRAEREFLAAERWSLTDRFAEEVYLHFDDDRERFRRHQRLIDLAARIEYGALLEGALCLAQLSDPDWARAAGRVLRAAFADSLDAEILLDHTTPYGRILIGGTTPHAYREERATVVIDLGGNDFYAHGGGAGVGWDLPLALCIDLAGDDAYETTLPGGQGTGCLGLGGLLDLSGDDTYIGRHWCQGTGYFGIGWLQDAAGNDTYRGRSFCQGVGLFGIGLLVDNAGVDRYEGDGHVQGVGLAAGLGLLVDADGNDEYYAKGLYPTGYGDVGVFDAWSQGCGQGFRTLASGGLGVVLDGGGCDRMEAGNFSQGGGYYYGLGILEARGGDDDHYIGSRYNQGFCAHQALGVFREEGGNDRYETRQGVAQGLAWDECVTLFMDAAGNDHYQGGNFFSLAAAAHNSFCFFLDRAGSDVYDYPPGPARAGGNDYHGGISFALFVDEGGGTDRYSAPWAGNNQTRHAPTHGFFLDLPGRLPDVSAASGR